MKFKQTVLTMVTVGTLSFGVGKLMIPSPPNVDWKEHFVEPGDSVWTIAKESNVHHSDLRDVVDMIQSHNKINTDLKPGMIIEYPVEKK